MCIVSTRYAHRTRKELLVEEVKVVNPTVRIFFLFPTFYLCLRMPDFLL